MSDGCASSISYDEELDIFADEVATFLLVSDDTDRALETVTEYLFERYAAAHLPDGEITPEGLGSLEDLPLAFDELSPAIIGKGFDGVIARVHGQKDTGSYYTPEEIVDFQVRQTVRPSMRDRLDGGGVDVAGLDDVPTPAAIADACSPDEAKAVLAGLETFSSLDPACGSGQYLAGLTHELADVREALADRAELDVPRATHVWQTVTTNVYGVDIHQAAVEIAKLRLKLLTVEALPDDAPMEDIETIREGNALHWQIRQGNSLIGLTELPESTPNESTGQTTLSGGEWA